MDKKHIDGVIHVANTAERGLSDELICRDEETLNIVFKSFLLTRQKHRQDLCKYFYT